MRRLVQLLAVLSLGACSPDRFRIVDGPASLTVGATLWTPEASAKVEEGGRAWFGPEPPPVPEYVNHVDKQPEPKQTSEARP